MNKFLIHAGILLLATVPLIADSFSITTKITSTQDGTTIPTGTYQGSFATNGTCSSCTTLANGGITSFDVPINTGNPNIIPTVLLFDALDTGTQLQYSTATQLLSGIPIQLGSQTTFPSIILLAQIMSGSSYIGYITLEMTPTSLNTPATACDDLDTVRRGCVTIRSYELPVAQGTYTITALPAAGGCPATIGFWKHHPFPNSVQTGGMTIGGVDYSPANLLTILNSKGGNAVAILGRQLVGALLNLAAAGVHNSTADGAIAAAQALLVKYNLNLLTSSVSPSLDPGPALIAQSTILDNYNNADFNTCREGSGLITGK
jgi:hypothetical protein